MKPLWNQLQHILSGSSVAQEKLTLLTTQPSIELQRGVKIDVELVDDTCRKMIVICLLKILQHPYGIIWWQFGCGFWFWTIICTNLRWMRICEPSFEQNRYCVWFVETKFEQTRRWMWICKHISSKLAIECTFSDSNVKNIASECEIVNHNVTQIVIECRSVDQILIVNY